MSNETMNTIDYGEPTEPGWYLVEIGGISQPRKFVAMSDGRTYCRAVALANGATVRFGPRIPEDWAECWDLGRAQDLRRQAEKTCERRTARIMAAVRCWPLSLGFGELVEQVVRLRRTQCPTMGWQSNSGPAGQIAAIDRELAELKLEEPGTEDFAAEAADLLTTIINLLVSADLDPSNVAKMQADKLARRLDHIDRGGTWAGAKADEKIDGGSEP